MLVTTIRKRCRVCYTCVRECPAKAIRIAEGQAEVLHERCIGCGNCIKVCSQNAKQMVSTVAQARAIIDVEPHVAALIAPSFPAEFTEFKPEVLVGMLRSLGFDFVCEVAFGADLVARENLRVLRAADDRHYITSSCPAVNTYIQRYAPQLIGMLIPVVSPMVATARALRALHGDDLKVVFIGPCIAKKGEAGASEIDGEINAAITFIELREMFMHRGINANAVKPSDFDPPHGRLGGLFPLKRGSLQTAGIYEDLLADEVVTAEGHQDFVAAIRAFESGDTSARLLDVLCCEGCVMGQGMSTVASQFTRRSQVSRYVTERLQAFDAATWQEYMDRFADLDLSRGFANNDQRLSAPSEDEITEYLAAMGKFSPEDELNCGACGYETCREHVIAIHKGLAESEMCLPYTIEQMHRTVQELNESHQALATTQEQLMHSEKLASMGQLAAGIAHEVNNPLGVVLMYAHLMMEQCPADSQQCRDLEMIVREADRCKKIVGGLLNFARQNKVSHQRVDIRELIERAVANLPAPEGITVSTDLAIADPHCELDFDQLVQVVTNLIKNAYDAMPEGGELHISATGDDESIQLTISDTGAGIAPENLDKLYTPFFTTKEPGQGTGLGLSVIYGIVKMHRGQIDVRTNHDPAAGPTGAAFTVSLPRTRRIEQAG
ncbi:4Fe-4S binding protein [bacterium]|nr:4Fe-4S binding protein [bacterium]